MLSISELNELHNLNAEGNKIIVPYQENDSDKIFSEAFEALVNLLSKIIHLNPLFIRVTSESPNDQGFFEPFTRDYIKYLSNKVFECNNEMNLVISNLNSSYVSVSYNEKEKDFRWFRHVIKCCDGLAININDVIKKLNEINKDNKDLIIEYVKLLSKELSMKNISIDY